MIKLKPLLETRVVNEMNLPPGIKNQDFESIDDFLYSQGAITQDELKQIKIKEAEDNKFLGATVKDFPDIQAYLQKVASKEKSAGDKFNYPYFHRSNILDENGKILDLDVLREKIKQRPQKILQQNSKIQKSGDKNYIFFNISLPAFKGLIVDESTGEFKIVNTCPGAGSCKVYCYARKGGYVQWKSSSLFQTRLLNFLLNDWNGFKTQLLSELKNITNRFKNKGYIIVLRWHDSGDFMSEKYLSLAYDIARETPEIIHYAYTKMIGMVSASAKPKNFVFNFSQGSVEDEMLNQIKDKKSIVVPNLLFKDHVVKNKETGKLEFKSDSDMNRVKEKLSAKYNIEKNTIITYDELMKIPYDQNNESHIPKWNVIVKPGDGDDAAMRKDVVGMYLFIH